MILSLLFLFFRNPFPSIMFLLTLLLVVAAILFWNNDSVLDPSEIIAVRFRDFACETSTQGQGVVTALLKHAMHFACSELKAEVLWSDATVSSVDWYSRRGLSRIGQKFSEGSQLSKSV
ncbi:hypothetical protein DFJ43DRAFT_1057734 [Lentinula guzmanii]|uniref:N-acetyltransferase domain-containing protein n=1 Tax=Lentinula guzmanii TaxID=2804957 RepID=A0AA38JNF7_9AGAR|nr:hypothetical protein DFJ43DRAFT_1057734 [Lentinula guzmanii]